MRKWTEMEILGRVYQAFLANKVEKPELADTDLYSDLRNRTFFSNVDLSSSMYSDEELIRFMVIKAFMKECGYHYDCDDLIWYLSLQFERLASLDSYAKSITQDKAFLKSASEKEEIPKEQYEITIAGVPYTVKLLRRVIASELDGAAGLCDFNSRIIKIDLTMDEGDSEAPIAYWYTVLMHEMVHALMYETGVGPECSWGALNEGNVDWIATMYTKLEQLNSKIEQEWAPAFKQAMEESSDSWTNVNHFEQPVQSFAYAPSLKRIRVKPSGSRGKGKTVRTTG